MVLCFGQVGWFEWRVARPVINGFPAKDSTSERRGRGRPPATSRARIDEVSLDLFLTKGFTQTSVEDVCAAVEIGRSTFFRYYRSKSDIIWLPIVDHVDAGARELVLAARGLDLDVRPVADHLVEDLARLRLRSGLRERIHVIEACAELRAEESEKWRGWRDGVAQLVARRHGFPVDDVQPQTVAGAVWVAYLAALRSWASGPVVPVASSPAADLDLLGLATVLDEWLCSRRGAELSFGR